MAIDKQRISWLWPFLSLDASFLNSRYLWSFIAEGLIPRSFLDRVQKPKGFHKPSLISACSILANGCAPWMRSVLCTSLFLSFHPPLEYIEEGEAAKRQM